MLFHKNGQITAEKPSLITANFVGCTEIIACFYDVEIV